MPFKMKGTAMYDKVMKDGKATMALKKEFGGAMDMKSPMDKSPMDKSPMDKSPMDKSPMDKAPMDLRDDSAMDMSHMKLTQDAAMKLTSAMKKMSPMEANAFIGAKMAAEKEGKDTFEVGGKTFNVR
tara:strand:+ start:100 stop:480 length:381 start_codon:yes stop_codon:yes gene_type:complete